MPLTAGGEDVGALVFGGATRRQPMFLSTLAASAAVAIQNAQRSERERETVAQLSELSRMKSTFLATVSHELRTPLAAVLGLAELLARPESGVTPERRTQMSAQVLEQAQLLSVMIEDLLDATRVEFGGLRVRRERIDVARIAERVHDTFHAARPRPPDADRPRRPRGARRRGTARAGAHEPGRQRVQAHPSRHRRRGRGGRGRRATCMSR